MGHGIGEKRAPKREHDAETRSLIEVKHRAENNLVLLGYKLDVKSEGGNFVVTVTL